MPRGVQGLPAAHLVASLSHHSKSLSQSIRQGALAPLQVSSNHAQWFCAHLDADKRNKYLVHNQRSCEQCCLTTVSHTTDLCTSVSRSAPLPTHFLASLRMQEGHSLRGRPTRRTKRLATGSNDPGQNVSCLRTSSSDALENLAKEEQLFPKQKDRQFQQQQ